MLAVSLLITVGAAGVRAQETWAPVIMFDGIDISLNGAPGTPIVGGPVDMPPAIYPAWDYTLYPNRPFLYPNGFCENPITNEWIVADTYHGRLLRFATDHNPDFSPGTFLGAISTSLNHESSFPYGPIVDADGTIVVADSDAHAVKAFVSDGVGGYDGYAITSYSDGWTDPQNPSTVAFSQPYRIAFLPDPVNGMHLKPVNGMHLKDGVGSLLVLDAGANRVLKLLPTGGVAAPVWSLQLAFGSSAEACACAGAAIFNFPTGLAVDAAGNIYISDPNNATTVTIQVFDPTGQQVQVISQGLSVPWSLTIAPDGRLFVTDTGNNRIAIFSKLDVGNPAASLLPVAARIGSASQPLGGVFLPNGPNAPGAMGELQEPTSIAFDQFGRLLVADTDNARMQIFDKAHLSIAAVALPQTVAASASTVDVRVTVTLPAGENAITNVVPSVPSVSFSPAGDPSGDVIDPTPSCIITPASTSGFDCRPLTAFPLAPSGQLVYTFRFNRIPGAVGPVWFSVNATGLDNANNPVSSATAQTYAVAIDAVLPGNPPSIQAALDPANDPPSNNWFKTSPVLIDLTATVPGAADGVVQAIEYNFGPTPPAEGDFYVCFNVFSSDHPDTASCVLPVFKSGTTTLWYRALSSRGLYDRLVPYGPDPTILVPGWRSIVVNLDFSPPVFSFSSLGSGSNGWFNQLPVTVNFTAQDTESLINTVSVSASTGLNMTWSLNAVSNTPFANGSFTFTSEGVGDVTLQATDRAGNQWVQVESFKIDATPPTIGATPAVSSPTGVVTLGTTRWSRSPITVTFTATDNRSGFDAQSALTTNCAVTISSGTGQLATCTVQDQAGNTATRSVGPFGIDSVAPTLTLTATSVTAYANPTTAVVNYTGISVSDNVDPSPVFSCSPASGSVFPFGLTTVSCTATDAVGNTSALQSFTVNVLDNIKPVLTVPANISVTAIVPTAVTFAVSATDNVDPRPAISCSPASGSTFPLGQTIVSCTGTDASGNSTTRTFTVTVTPHTAPVCTAAQASPSALWPPNHQWVPIVIQGVTNADGGAVTYTVTSIFQDEPTSGLGDGDTPIDGQGVGTGVAKVRSERSGTGNGRVYHINFTATSAGGACSGSVKVDVPHDQGHGPAVDGGALYDSTKAPPVAQNDAANALTGTPIVIAVLGNDSDPLGYTLAMTSLTSPAHGTATLNANGTITYKSATGFTGTDAFSYTISNGHGGVATATVTVKVKAHFKGDDDDHDKKKNGHRDGDGCEHDKAVKK